MQDFLKLVEDKRHGKEHSTQDIDWIVGNLDSIPDYQLSAWLMAVCINGLSDAETTELTRAMAFSGHVLTLQRHRPDEINRGFVDKHSTGGVGDKVSLVQSPLLASIGFKVSKFSGRSLGHTGGTVDKLEAIPGFKTDIDMRSFEKQIDNIGLALASQTLEFAPADKRLYALRDKSGTVESIPLIASSVMSKKIAGGADIIILDVKCGSGAFMKDKKSASALAKLMKKIGEGLKLNVKALVTDMNQPLGSAIGNALEVKEAIETLKGNNKNDFYELCISLSETIAERKELEEAIASGKAYAKFKEFISAQHGDLDAFEASLNNSAIHSLTVKATEDGYVKELDALKIGQIVHELGYVPVHQKELVLPNGTEDKSSSFDGATGKPQGENNASIKNYEIDNLAGITLHAKTGNQVKAGEPIFTIQGKDKDKVEAMQEKALNAYLFSKSKTKAPKLVLEKFV